MQNVIGMHLGCLKCIAQTVQNRLAIEMIVTYFKKHGRPQWKMDFNSWDSATLFSNNCCSTKVELK
jgi:hypothetical protein